MTMRVMTAKKLVLAAVGVLAGCAIVGAWAIAQTATQTTQTTQSAPKKEINSAVAGVSTAFAAINNIATIAVVVGMPPVIDAKNLYSETVTGKMSAAM
jgi:hypothetical protein